MAGEIQRRKKEGSVICDRISISPIFNESNEIINFVSVSTDITFQKGVERRILQTIIDTEEKERERFAMDLHDEIGPLLSAAIIYLKSLQNPASKMDKNEVVINAHQLIDQAKEKTRQIAFNLSPHLLQNFGLHEALRSLAATFEKASGIAITVRSGLNLKFDYKTEVLLYRILSECINNTIKYANATEISISFKYKNSTVVIEYNDNGVGFDPDDELTLKKGSGIGNMKNRLKLVNGTIEIISSVGKGTKILIKLVPEIYS